MSALAVLVASVERIVVALVAVLTAPSTTSAAEAGAGRISAWVARAPPAAAAAVSSDRRVRGAGMGPADSVPKGSPVIRVASTVASWCSSDAIDPLARVELGTPLLFGGHVPDGAGTHLI